MKYNFINVVNEYKFIHFKFKKNGNSEYKYFSVKSIDKTPLIFQRYLLF